MTEDERKIFNLKLDVLELKRQVFVWKAVAVIMSVGMPIVLGALWAYVDVCA